MRRQGFGSAFAASAIAISLAIGGCASSGAPGGDLGSATMVQRQAASGSMTAGNGEKMTENERAVLKAYGAMQQAMVDKDVDAMRALTVEDKTFTHMSGKVQTREEFFGEIADGTLNYFGYEIHDPHVTIEGNRATLTGSTTLDVRVYGMTGSWTLPTNAHFAKVDGRWIQCD